MTQRTWVIVGATSIIAEKFAQIAAKAGHDLVLAGRDNLQLELIAEDIKLRYQANCRILVLKHLHTSPEEIVPVLNQSNQEIDLFIAQSDFTGNSHLDHESINRLVNVNILSTTLLINAYLSTKQTQHNILYLSSVAACRGRAKNSLYGATKAAIEIYLQGLQQAATPQQHITIARLGFIDTRQTYGLPGIFYAAPPEECAQACFNASTKKKESSTFHFSGAA